MEFEPVTAEMSDNAPSIRRAIDVGNLYRFQTHAHFVILRYSFAVIPRISVYNRQLAKIFFSAITSFDRIRPLQTGTR